MAVRAQYLPNFLPFNRDETEMNDKEIDMDFPHDSLLRQSPAIFNSGGNTNRRQRLRETVTMEAPPHQQQHQSVFSLHAPCILDLSQIPPPTTSFVSTGLGLCLALNEQKHRQVKTEQPDSLVPAFYSEELGAQINRENNEIEQFLLAQGEQLRQALVERQKGHCRAVLELVGRRLREKEAEVKRAARCNTELEERLARFQTESMAWQAKALSEQAAAASLHAQLQKAAAAAAAAEAASAELKCGGESQAEDEESAHVDPCRSNKWERPCRACLRWPATVVLFPCRHLCLCLECDSAGAASGCPACGCFRTGSLQISF